MADRPQSTYNVRRRRDVQVAVREFRDEATRREDPCWLCQKPIDYTIADPYDDWVLEVEHVVAVSLRPDLAADKGNMRASHRLCNQRKSDSTAPQGLGATSEDWEGMADDLGGQTTSERGEHVKARRRDDDFDDVFAIV
jgi:hypothetical protein